MKKSILNVIALASIFILSSCGSSKQVNSVILSLQNADPDYKYQIYDSSFSSNSFNIRKIESLQNKTDFLNGFDASLVAHIEQNGGKYYDKNCKEQDIFKILKNNNVNAIRLRLYYDYDSPIGVNGSGNLDKEQILSMAKRAKKQGQKIILDLHYSDSWADPANQACPYEWRNLTFDQVKTNVYNYTKEILEYMKSNKINVDYIQIGNEINNGLIYPYGKIDYSDKSKESASLDNVVELLGEGCKATRNVSPNTKIIIHASNAVDTYKNNYQYLPLGEWFYQQLDQRNLDYDIIGSSFYTFYSPETPIESITNSINRLTAMNNKQFMLMEYSYAYTLNYTDNTANLFGVEQIKNSYPVSIQGQTNMMIDIIEQVANATNSIGTCYWGGEWIPGFNVGASSSDLRSTWANQALFTYDGIEVPSLSVFKNIY